MSDFAQRLYNIWEPYATTSSCLIENLHVKIERYFLKEGTTIMATRIDAIQANCYVASAYSMMVTYSKDEICKINSFFYQMFSHFLVNFFSLLLKSAKIDTLQVLNNYLLSTNFFSRFWEEEVSPQVLQDLAIQRHPNHALLIRSLNKIQNPKLIKKLEDKDWLCIVSRQVYIFQDWGKCKKTRNFQIDKKLLNSTRFVFVVPNLEEIQDFEEAKRLYDKLYLEKYSIHNVQFSAIYLQALCKEGLLHLRLLKDTKNDCYVGVVGMMGEEDVITTPIVGYDTSYPLEDALYRRLIAYSLSYSMTRDYRLNLSSGAPLFKTLRGADATLEYMYVYVKHLCFYRRFIWRILSIISLYFYGPLLKRFKL